MSGTHLPDSADLVVTGARSVDGSPVEVVITDGTVTRIGPAAALGVAAAATLDASGLLVLSPLVEPHAHLDKALTAADVPNPQGDLAGAIAAWRAARPGRTAADTAARAREAALALLASGTTLVRSHVDTGRDIGGRSLDAVLAVRDELRDVLDLEVVPLASLPLTGLEGREHLAALRDAIDGRAVAAIGGAPYLDEDPAAALDALAELAAELGIGLDLHVDETLDPTRFTLLDLVALRRRGFRGPLVAGHVVSLAVQPDAVRRQTAEELAAADVAVVGLPQTNLHLQGRAAHGPVQRGLSPLPLLVAAGVRVAVGGDNVQDPFNPLGRNDPLEAASLGVAAGHLTLAQSLHAVSDGARRALGAAPAGPVVGAVADLVLIDAATPDRAVAEAPATRIVLRAGREVARTTVEHRVAGSRVLVGGVA